MSTVNYTLDQLRTLGPHTPSAALRASKFFLAGSGVLTLAFEGLTAGLIDLKTRISVGLRAEHPGSTWPKVTLAALNTPNPLSDQEVAQLWSATTYADSMLAAEPTEVRIGEVVAVEALTRSLEMTGRKVQVSLGDHVERTVPDSHGQYVRGILDQWNQNPSGRYLAMLRKMGHGRDHYHRPCLIRTMVAYQPVEIAAVDALRERLDRVLPGRYHWFDPSARHITLRTLELASTESELEAVELLADNDLDP